MKKCSHDTCMQFANKYTYDKKTMRLFRVFLRLGIKYSFVDAANDEHRGFLFEKFTALTKRHLKVYEENS